nr:immunoglobulin light chain junction region [Macaca mulatta]MOV67191.1 immunoglobulin light chain junction region [Macaca mulatta]MOV68777.1 immunoglobulin light chain junction region [Macaca mulatta]MOV69665.1 immunoglobulin light chain junction region [Macaca mulatta]MOV70359.1 immunoglobulin light chain junction region [Macaca mulatta]
DYHCQVFDSRDVLF